MTGSWHRIKSVNTPWIEPTSHLLPPTSPGRWEVGGGRWEELPPHRPQEDHVHVAIVVLITQFGDGPVTGKHAKGNCAVRQINPLTGERTVHPDPVAMIVQPLKPSAADYPDQVSLVEVPAMVSPGMLSVTKHEMAIVLCHPAAEPVVRL